jgi:hypothetical protein
MDLHYENGFSKYFTDKFDNLSPHLLTNQFSESLIYHDLIHSLRDITSKAFEILILKN